MANRYSSFPDKIDEIKQIPEYQSLNAEQKDYQSRYFELIQKGNQLTHEEITELQDLMYNKLRSNMITDKDWNVAINAVMESQRYFKDHVLTDISTMVNTKENEFSNVINTKSQEFTDTVDNKTNEFTNVVENKSNEINTKLDNIDYKDEFNPDIIYYKNNIVKFNDGSGYRKYMATKNPPKGTLPSNSIYWETWDIKGETGEKGQDGVNLIVKGTWNKDNIYKLGVAVHYGGCLFATKIDNNVGNIPDLTGDTDYWYKVLDVTITVDTMKGIRTIVNETTDINFMCGDIIAYNSKTDDLEVYQNTVNLIEGIHYELNTDGRSIHTLKDIWDGTNEPIIFKFKVTRNMINDLVFSDGQSIQNETVSKNKLTTDIQNKINKVETNQNKIEILNQDVGEFKTSTNEQLTDIAKEVEDINPTDTDKGRYQAEWGFYNIVTEDKHNNLKLKNNGNEIEINLIPMKQSFITHATHYNGDYNTSAKIGIIFTPKVDITGFDAEIPYSYHNYCMPQGYELINYDTGEILKTYPYIQFGQNIGAYDGVLKKGVKYALYADGSISSYIDWSHKIMDTDIMENDLFTVISGYEPLDRIGVFKSIIAEPIIPKTVIFDRVVNPTNLVKWGNLNFDIYEPSGSTVKCDILSLNNDILLSDIKKYVDLSQLNIESYKGLKVRFYLNRIDKSPKIKNFSITYSSQVKQQWEKIASIITDEINNIQQIEFNNLHDYKMLKLDYQVITSNSSSNGYYFKLNDKSIYCPENMSIYREYTFEDGLRYGVESSKTSPYVSFRYNNYDFTQEMIINYFDVGSKFTLWGCRQ